MTIGVYAIRNKINRKVYVGQSLDCECRWYTHKYALKQEIRDKSVNRHLFNSVKKYGIESFEFEILEKIESPGKDALFAAELKWMKHFNSLDRAFGYNLRSDNHIERNIVSEETRLLLSESMKGVKNPNFGNKWSEEMKSRMSEKIKSQYDNGRVISESQRLKISQATIRLWQDPVKKSNMAKKVSQRLQKYDYYQYTKEGVFVAKYSSKAEILSANPDYYVPAIYGCCSGYKKSYKGFIWKKQLRYSRSDDESYQEEM